MFPSWVTEDVRGIIHTRVKLWYGYTNLIRSRVSRALPQPLFAVVKMGGNKKCPFCQYPDETPTHFIFHCPQFNSIRLNTIHRFLNSNFYSDNQLQHLLNNPAGRYSLINYIGSWCCITLSTVERNIATLTMDKWKYQWVV